jgi:hypothetical protein
VRGWRKIFPVVGNFRVPPTVRGEYHLTFTDSPPPVSIRRKGLLVSAPNPGPLPEGAKPKLSIVKGLRPGKTYGLKDGVNYLGRKGPMEIDVDLTEQENPGVAVAVNRFALVWFDKNGLGIADTGTRLGTIVNGAKIPAKKRFPLKADDTIQFGKTVLQVKIIIKSKTGVQK